MTKDHTPAHTESKNPEGNKPHAHGDKEMPSSLPGQKVSSDGKKLPLTDAEKAEHNAA